LNIIDQLIQFHRGEWFQAHDKQTDEQLRLYFETMVRKNRMIFAMQGDEVLGYAESYRLDYAQFGRLVCGEDIVVDREDVETGPIAYLANVHVKEAHQSSWPIKYLKLEFFKQNYTASYFCGYAERKKHRPWKIFKRQQLQEVITREL